MRKDALLIGLVAGIGFLNVVHAEEGMRVCVACQGVAQETPNQQRQQLGLPIPASYPPPNYGHAVETPNHRRKRFGLPLPKAVRPPSYGIAEETPNQKRRRLEAEAALNATGIAEETPNQKHHRLAAEAALAENHP